MSQNKIISNIKIVYKKAKNCQLNDMFFLSINDELVILSKFFRVTKIQAFFIAMIFALNNKKNSVDFNDLSEYFNCDPIEVLEFYDCFDFLRANDFIIMCSNDSRLFDYYSYFGIDSKISIAILFNKPFPIKNKKYNDVFDLLEKLFSLSIKRSVGHFSTNEMLKKMKKIIHKNSHFKLIQEIISFNFSKIDTYLLFYLLWSFICGVEIIGVNYLLEQVFDTKPKRLKYKTTFITSKNVLIYNNLISTIDVNNNDDFKLKLTFEFFMQKNNIV